MCLQAVRLSTEEAISNKRNSEDEILLAFQALDVDKKGYLEAHELQTLMTTYGEKFSNEEVNFRQLLLSFSCNYFPSQVKEMMAAAVDVELGRVYYEDYAEILAAE